MLEKLNPILQYIPGFRSLRVWKMAVAFFYYLLAFSMIRESLGLVLVALSCPFIIFHCINLIRYKVKNISVLKAFVPFAASITILFTGVAITPNSIKTSAQQNIEKIDKLKAEQVAKKKAAKEANKKAEAQKKAQEEAKPKVEQETKNKPQEVVNKKTEQKTAKQPAQKPVTKKITINDYLKEAVINSMGKDSNRDMPRLVSVEDGDKGIKDITVNADDNFTSNMIVVGMHSDAKAFFKKVTENEDMMKLEAVSLIFNFSMVDKLGNSSEAPICIITMNTNILRKINWDNFSYDNFPDVGRTYFLHPSLNK